MNSATIGFVYNAPCPLACNFCCHTQEVVGPGRAEPANVGPAMVRFAMQESVTDFAFTGGDPFVYYAEIIKIMVDVRRAGVRQPFRMVTSGFWAKSPEMALERLAALAGLGMNNLCVSYDHEHARWVSSEQIRWIAGACRETGVEFLVYGVFWSEGEKLEEMLPAMPGVKMHSNLVTSIGRARELAGEAPRYHLPEETKYTCRQPRHYDITVYPNGDTYPCCSGGFNKEAGLGCGNAFTEPAEAILTRVYTLLHARIAKEIGFDRLYAKVREQDKVLYERLPRFADVDSVCQICRNLRTQPGLQEELAGIYEEMEIEYVLRCVEEHDEKLNLFQTQP
ncbi:radical SAM protein [Paracidobacterium acidisoli]|uniref:4Fe-4S cluster-binding domain-containing protein n=1 Tax=Paracidobacterium acidisoli TaxID=2303751 RepID=A0A372IM84_9BACT|nr:radical SAM protein [Paracidobacterium acidisoli]MBT9331669.1 radical SAM protein [Paracidobacterium acidisoli]